MKGEESEEEKEEKHEEIVLDYQLEKETETKEKIDPYDEKAAKALQEKIDQLSKNKQNNSDAQLDSAKEIIGSLLKMVDQLKGEGDDDDDFADADFDEEPESFDLSMASFPKIEVPKTEPLHLTSALMFKELKPHMNDWQLKAYKKYGHHVFFKSVKDMPSTEHCSYIPLFEENGEYLSGFIDSNTEGIMQLTEINELEIKSRLTCHDNEFGKVLGRMRVIHKSG